MRFTQHGCLNLEQDIRVLVTKLSDLFPDVPVSFLFWKKNNMHLLSRVSPQVRNIFSRVHQIFYVLNVESLQDAALLQVCNCVFIVLLMCDKINNLRPVLQSRHYIYWLIATLVMFCAFGSILTFTKTLDVAQTLAFVSFFAFFLLPIIFSSLCFASFSES